MGLKKFFMNFHLKELLQQGALTSFALFYAYRSFAAHAQ